MLGCFPGFFVKTRKRVGNYRQERRAICLFGSTGYPDTAGLGKDAHNRTGTRNSGRYLVWDERLGLLSRIDKGTYGPGLVGFAGAIHGLPNSDQGGATADCIIMFYASLPTSRRAPQSKRQFGEKFSL
jgi:hypothetical protein